MADFVKVKGRKTIHGIQDPNSTKKEDVEILKKALEAKEQAIKSSELFQHIQSDLSPGLFTRIRCLALGSPSQNEPALYQLALLRLLTAANDVEDADVSLYDPVFSPLDIELFKELHYKHEDSYDSEHRETLYFLPHAPLSLTSKIIKDDAPQLLLANNIITHTDRLTKSELFDKYPTLAKLTSLVDVKNSPVDDFKPVVSKRKSRKSKNKFKEPELDYSKIEAHFQQATVTSYKDFEEGAWLNSFTDIALHRLS